MTVRTRFAPSPTGQLHLGNARTAVLNWLFARHCRGRFVVRFEDTDLERQMESAERGILESLDWLGLDRDEDPLRGGPYGPYRQSERLEIYRERVAGLLERGLAFRCYCLPEELARRREAALKAGGSPRYDGRCRELDPEQEARFRACGRAPAVRFRVEPGPIRFRDRRGGELTIDGAEFGDMVILRSDGRPTYNLAVVVDDIDMRISHVVRGSGHLSNTPKQVLLYQAFGAPVPEFLHIPTVLAPSGGKLSKRAGATSLLEYREAGYHPDAVLNYLSLLSWSAPSGRECLTRQELIREIDLDRIGASNATLDLEKMRWLSGRHIRMESVGALADRLRSFMDTAGLGMDERDLAALAEITRERVHLLSEAAEEGKRLFTPPDPMRTQARGILSEPSASAVLRAAREVWAETSEWTRDVLRQSLPNIAARAGATGRALYQPLRAALTGERHGPELPDVVYVLGRDRVLRRLDRAGGDIDDHG